MNKTILLVEDDESLRRVMEFQLAEKGYVVRTAGDGELALRLFGEAPPDLVVTDMTLPRLGGLELLRAVKREAPRVPVIVITAFGTIETAVQAMRDGAFHYVTKPISNEELALVVAQALDYGALSEENQRLRQELRERHRFENILGDSAAMKRVEDMVSRVAGRDVTVLLEGESGTGKELIARAIHYNSARAAGPFVPVNCGAIPKDLVESELFGARKGAFTGATHDRAGQFEQADKGTIFLDEIVELPPEAQVKLLRVLQDRVVTPLGGEKPIPVDVRVIAATNRSLETAVAEGDLREDIFYRLNVVTISLPPLRDRRDDIPVLVRHFLEKFGQPQCKVSPEAWEVPFALPMARQRAPTRERDSASAGPPAQSRRDRRRGPSAGTRPAFAQTVSRRLRRVPGRRNQPRGKRERADPDGAGESRQQPDARRATARHQPARAALPDAEVWIAIGLFHNRNRNRNPNRNRRCL